MESYTVCYNVGLQKSDLTFIKYEVEPSFSRPYGKECLYSILSLTDSYEEDLSSDGFELLLELAQTYDYVEL